MRREVEQRRTAPADRLPAGVEESPAERWGKSDSAVGRRGSPEAHQHPATRSASASAMSSPVPKVVARRAVATIRTDQLESGGAGELDHAGGCRAHRTALDGVTERSGDRAVKPARRRILRRREHVESSLAAVGERGEVDLVVGARPVPSALDCLGRLLRAQRAAELVGTNQNAHVGDCTIPPNRTGRAAAS